MSAVLIALVLLALVLFAVAAAGVTHSRVQLVPLAFALLVLVYLLRVWSP